jgi:signal transduction histidine kinase
LTAAFLVLLAVRAYLNKYYESGPVLVGIIGLVAGWILESIGGLDLLQITGFFLWDYSVGFFMICVMYALTARYTRIKKELREAAIAIFRAHEDERKRLARELHDGIGPSLSAIKLELQLLESTAGDKNKETCHKIVRAIADVSEEIRSISMNLRPVFLENAGLVEAIGWHADNLQKKSGIRINIKNEGQGGLQLSSQIKDNLYRIYQESLNNAVKHSGATVVDIILALKGRFLTMEIKDNGQGFDLAQAEIRKQGIGLHTIRERAGLLNGVCRIQSAKKHGTSIWIKVPLT